MAAQKEVKKSVSGGEEGDDARICGIKDMGESDPTMDSEKGNVP